MSRRRNQLDSDSNDVQDATSSLSTTVQPFAATVASVSTFNVQVTSITTSLDQPSITERPRYSPVDTFRIKVWKPEPLNELNPISAKFWITIPRKLHNKCSFTIAERQAFCCPYDGLPINLPTELLVKLVSGYEESPVHHAFPCGRCGSEINVTAEW